MLSRPCSLEIRIWIGLGAVLGLGILITVIVCAATKAKMAVQDKRHRLNRQKGHQLHAERAR